MPKRPSEFHTYSVVRVHRDGSSGWIHLSREGEASKRNAVVLRFRSAPVAVKELWWVDVEFDGRSLTLGNLMLGVVDELKYVAFVSGNDFVDAVDRYKRSRSVTERRKTRSQQEVYRRSVPGEAVGFAADEEVVAIKKSELVRMREALRSARSALADTTFIQAVRRDGVRYNEIKEALAAVRKALRTIDG